tara:strand:- start:104 stop:487 length:384 start_codon:yes stop_codon:yes gene_type:complete
VLSKWLVVSLKEKPINFLWITMGIIGIFFAKYIDGESYGDSLFQIGTIISFVFIVISFYDIIAKLLFKESITLNWLVVFILAIVILFFLSHHTGRQQVVSFLILALFVSVIMTLYKFYLKQKNKMGR